MVHVQPIFWQAEKVLQFVLCQLHGLDCELGWVWPCGQITLWPAKNLVHFSWPAKIAQSCHSFRRRPGQICTRIFHLMDQPCALPRPRSLVVQARFFGCNRAVSGPFAFSTLLETARFQLRLSLSLWLFLNMSLRRLPMPPNCRQMCCICPVPLRPSESSKQPEPSQSEKSVPFLCFASLEIYEQQLLAH